MSEARDSLALLVDALETEQRVLALHESDYQEAEFDFRHNNAELISQMNASKARIAEIDAKVRESAVALYRSTAEKDPLGNGAATVKDVRRIRYDPAEAFGWLIGETIRASNDGDSVVPFTHCLNLDRTAFEKLALAMRPDFVTVDIEPQANVSHNLHAKVRSTEDRLAASVAAGRGKEDES